MTLGSATAVALGGMALLGRWPTHTTTVRDESTVDVRAVLRRVVCRVTSSGPDTTAGPGQAAIPPVWFERGTVAVLGGAVDLHLHEWSAEPAALAVRVALGDVALAVPDDWVVALDVRTVGGRVVDERGGSPSAGGRGGTVHLAVTGWVALGRVRVVGREAVDP